MRLKRNLIHCHIDGDYIPHATGAPEKCRLVIAENGGYSLVRLEDTKELPPTEACYIDLPVSFCTTKIDTFIQYLSDKFNTDKLTIYVGDGKPTFRHKLCPSYKANRKDKPTVRWHKQLKEYVINNYNTVVVSDIEADDAVVIEGNKDKYGLIISNDKDVLMSSPGRFYDHNRREIFETTEEDAFYNFCIQVLTGDTADGIPGLQGIGPAKAKKALEGCGNKKELWDKVEYEYFLGKCRVKNLHFTKQAYLHEQATLLWIRRHNYPTYQDYLEA